MWSGLDSGVLSVTRDLVVFLAHIYQVVDGDADESDDGVSEKEMARVGHFGVAKLYYTKFLNLIRDDYVFEAKI